MSYLGTGSVRLLCDGDSTYDEISVPFPRQPGTPPDSPEVILELGAAVHLSLTGWKCHAGSTNGLAYVQIRAVKIHETGFYVSVAKLRDDHLQKVFASFLVVGNHMSAELREDFLDARDQKRRAEQELHAARRAKENALGQGPLLPPDQHLALKDGVEETTNESLRRWASRKGFWHQVRQEAWVDSLGSGKGIRTSEPATKMDADRRPAFVQVRATCVIPAQPRQLLALIKRHRWNKNETMRRVLQEVPSGAIVHSEWVLHLRGGRLLAGDVAPSNLTTAGAPTGAAAAAASAAAAFHDGDDLSFAAAAAGDVGASEDSMFCIDMCYSELEHIFIDGAIGVSMSSIKHPTWEAPESSFRRAELLTAGWLLEPSQDFQETTVTFAMSLDPHTRGLAEWVYLLLQRAPSEFVRRLRLEFYEAVDQDPVTPRGRSESMVMDTTGQMVPSSAVHPPPSGPGAAAGGGGRLGGSPGIPKKTREGEAPGSPPGARGSPLLSPKKRGFTGRRTRATIGEPKALNLSEPARSASPAPWPRGASEDAAGEPGQEGDQSSSGSAEGI